MASTQIALESIWNKYAIEEDEQRKKLWLDVFLCRAQDEPFLSTTAARRRVVPSLIAELKTEIGVFCGNNLAAEDLEQLRRYVYGGRGWRILRALDVILSESALGLPFLKDDDGKEFVDLLISLFQLSIFPHATPGRARHVHPSDTKDSVSALDLWHETLMNVASNEHERCRETNADAGIGSKLIPRTTKLWQHLVFEDKKSDQGNNPYSSSVMTRRQRKKATRTLLRGFASAGGGAANVSNFSVSNLFSYERRFSACSKISSDSESVEVDDLQRPQQINVLPKVKNPMDFDFFMGIVRSEDEASNQVEWQRLRARLASSPVTPTLSMDELKLGKEEVDLQRYLSSNHFKLMVARLNETQLSNLVVCLMSTICNVEIRWKLRQRKVQLPSSSPPSPLYSMSFPLVQFASDNICNAQSMPLKINLMALLLTGLSDLVVFGDIVTIIELFHHNKVLFKCLEVGRDVDPKDHQSQAEILVALLRVFRITLEKHANHKSLRNTNRCHKEELVKHICAWFSKDQGLGDTLTAALLLQSSSLRGCPDDVQRLLFEEIGHIVHAVGLCTTTSSRDEASYGYLKETRASLASLFNQVIKIATEVGSAEASSEEVIQALIDCLSKSICIGPHVAATCALSLLRCAPKPELLLNWLELVICHFYSRHIALPFVHEHQLTTSSKIEQHNPDSDSAICASDSSSFVDNAAVTSNGHHPEMSSSDRKKIQQSLWSPYQRALMSTTENMMHLQAHVERLIVRVEDECRRDIAAEVVLPVLESRLGKIAAKDDSLAEEEETKVEAAALWAMTAWMELLKFSPNLLPESFSENGDRFSSLMEKLIVTSCAEYQTELGFCAFRCLVAMLHAEAKCCQLKLVTDGKLSTDAIFVFPAIMRRLQERQNVSLDDLPLWKSICYLMQYFPDLFKDSPLQEDVYKSVHELQMTDALERNKELYSVILQIMSSCANDPENIQTKLDNITSQAFDNEGRLLPTVAKTVLNIFINGARAENSNESGSNGGPLSPFLFAKKDGNEADDETDDEHDGAQGTAFSGHLLSVVSLRRAIQFLRAIQEDEMNNTDEVVEYGLGKIHQLCQSHGANLCQLSVGEVALSLLKGARQATGSLISLATEVCQTSIEHGEPFTRELLRLFLGLVNDCATNNELALHLMQLLNAIVRSRWSASSTPLAYIRFPVLSTELLAATAGDDDEETDVSWGHFQLPCVNFGGQFSFSMWLSLPTDSLPSRPPAPICSLSNSHVVMEILLHDGCMAVGIATLSRSGGQKTLMGSTKFEPLPQSSNGSSTWCHLTLNCTLECSLFHVEIFLDGQRLRRDSIHLKSANLTPEAINDWPRVFRIGSVNDDEHDSQPWHYGMSRIFSRLLTAQEVLFLYLLGPSVKFLDEGGHLNIKPRSVSSKNFLLKDPQRAHEFHDLVTDVQKVIDLDGLRQALLSVHFGDKSCTHIFAYEPRNGRGRGPMGGNKGLLSSLFKSSSSVSLSASANNRGGEHYIRSTISASNNPIQIEVKDLFVGSWCEALQAQGGTSLLFLVLGRLVETGKSDAAIAQALNVLLTVADENITDPQPLDLALLLKILSASQKPLGLSTLHVLLEHAVTHSLLKYDAYRDVFNFTTDMGSIIYNTSILRLILDGWSLWLEAGESNFNDTKMSCPEIVLSCLQALVHDAHILRDINVQALRQMSIVQKLAFILKSQASDKLVPLVIDIFASLVGSPPDLSVVSELIHVALFLHESTYTYIHHAKQCFYFVLPSVVQNGSSNSTWPRRDNNFEVAETKKTTGLTKSASFTHHPSVPSIDTNAFEDDESSEEPNENLNKKLDPQRLQRVLKINKRSFHRKPVFEDVTSSSPPLPGLHFGHLTRLESMSASMPAVGNLNLADNEAGGNEDTREEVSGESPTMDERPDPSCAIEGVLNILYGALLNMPDSSVAFATTSIILPEYILTLVNHPDPHNRLASVRLLVKYVQRTYRLHPDGYRLDRIQGYQLMACQLFSWGFRDLSACSADRIAAALLSIVHAVEIGSTASLPELPTRGARVRSSALPPLLALLPPLAAAGSRHLAILHALFVHLHDIVARVHSFLRTEYDRLSIFEVLCKTLEALLTGSKELWTTDIYEQDGRDILLEDLDFLLRFIGMHLVSAHGSEHFRILELFLNMLLHMENFYADNVTVASHFRHFTLNILSDCTTDLMDRIGRQDSPSRLRGASFHSDLASQFVTNGETGLSAVAGEEVVTELLMRSLADDQQEQAPLNARRPRAPSFSSEESFSFRGDALRAHSHHASEGIKAASRGDLLERLHHLLHLGIEMCLHAPFEALPKDFIISLMVLLMGQLQHSRPLFTRQFCQSKLMVLSLTTLHPSVPLDDKLFLLKGLHQRQPLWTQTFFQLVLRDSTASDQVQLHRLFLTAFARDIKHSHGHEKWPFLTALETAEDKVGTPGLLLQDEPLVKRHHSQLHSGRLSFVQRNQIFMTRVQRNHEEKINAITTLAIDATAKAMSAQNALRKHHLISLRDQMAADIVAKRNMATLVESLTHQRGPWPRTMAQAEQYCWKLDEIEGAQRMRIRLSASARSLDSRFYREPPGSNNGGEGFSDDDEPFARLMKSSTTATPITSPMAAEKAAKTSLPPGLAEILVSQLSQQKSTSVKVMEPCWLVIPAGEVPGEILLTDSSLHFVQQGDISPSPLYMDPSLPLTVSIELDQIQEVLPRWYQLNDCALELFFEVGVTRLVAFPDRRRRDAFLSQLVSLNSHCRGGAVNWNGNDESRARILALHTQQWQEGLISNFDYLMHLNKLAGRTFNDLMQYPIFPFILSDYASSQLDLTSAKSFRDLRKPISVQHPEKEQQFRDNYRALADELQRSHEMTCPGVGPYHYGSHYSNTGIVLHFMVRLSPFTAMFLKYQDGSFDIPDRTFHDLEATWKLASGNSTTDVKELIPELFYLPEILRNNDSLDLGERQGGQRVDHVHLPPWARGDARLFIKIHRQALESNYVCENLHHWIDLIFGFKQKDAPSIEAINVFHPATYYGFDLNSIEDPVQRKARATMIKTYGQTPKQLFDRPHPMMQFRLTTRCRQSVAKPPLMAIESVVGAKWGNIVGLVPHSVAFADYAHPVSLLPVSQDRVFGLRPGHAAIVAFGQHGEDEDAAASGACIVGIDSLSGWAVAWLKMGESPRPLLPLEAGRDSIVSLAAVPGQCTVWAGYASGKLAAVRVNLNTKSLHLDLSHVTMAFGHASAINDIAPSREWSVVVTASEDGSSIIWDTRKLTYVRSIRNSGVDDGPLVSPSSPPHRLVKVSKTSGDIAIITAESDLLLYTINATSVARQERVEPPISAVAFSHVSEGVGINVVATGHVTTGVVRLWSTWDLNPLRDISTGHLSSSLLSVAFSLDCRYLYASFADGFLVILERSQTPSPRPPNYLDLSQMN